MAADLHDACAHGTAADCAAASAQVAAAIALHRAARAKPGEAPVEARPVSPEDPNLTFPRGTDVTNRSAFPPRTAPTPVTDAEVVASNAKNPASIKAQEPREHQKYWDDHSGKGTAPPAYRDTDGNIRVSKDSWLLKPPTRAGVPPVRPGPSKSVRPPAPPASVPKPASATREVGAADTGKAPAVDPQAKTPPAQPPPKAAPEKNVSPQAQTGEAAAESQRSQAPRGHIDPPQPISEEAIERIRNQPRVADPKQKGKGSNVNYSASHNDHQLAWNRLGGHDTAPPAFIYDKQVYLDPSRWPPKH